MPGVAVVLPALNAEATLQATLAELPEGVADDLILVDDGSSDRTVELARGLGLHVLRHDRTRGYGANQKSCYREALARGAEVVVMLHPDHQYDASCVPPMVELIRRGEADVVIGNRIRSGRDALRAGMPLYKVLGNRGLTTVQNAVTGLALGEWHSGLRAYSRDLLTTVPWQDNSDDFVFDSQLLLQAVHFGFRVGEVPTAVRYMDEASSISAARAVMYGVQTLGALARWSLHRRGAWSYPLLGGPVR